MALFRIASTLLFNYIILDETLTRLPLTAENGRAHMLTVLAPGFEPAWREKELLLGQSDLTAKTPRLEASVRKLIEALEELHEHDFGLASRALRWLEQTGIPHRLVTRTRKNRNGDQLRVTTYVNLSPEHAGMLRLFL